MKKIKLDYEITDIEYNTYYKDLFCVSTFDRNNWYHDGKIHIFEGN
jgi:hypothetical protein